MDWTDAKVEGDRQSRMEVLPDTHFLILDHAVCFGQTLFSQSPFHTHVTLQCTVTGEKVTSLFPWVLSVFVWVFNALPGPPLSLLIHPAPLHHALQILYLISCYRFDNIFAHRVQHKNKGSISVKTTKHLCLDVVGCELIN